MIIEIRDFIKDYPYPYETTSDPQVTLEFSVKEVSNGKLDITLIGAWGIIGYLDKQLIPAGELIRLGELAKEKFMENWTISKRLLE